MRESNSYTGSSSTPLQSPRRGTGKSCYLAYPRKLISHCISKCRKPRTQNLFRWICIYGWCFSAGITLYGSLCAHKYVALLNCCNTARHTDIGCMECTIIYVETIILWTVGLARVFIRGHTTVAALTLHGRADVVGFSYMGWNIVYLQVERTKERVRSRRAYARGRYILYYIYI